MFVQFIFAALSDIDIYFHTGDIDAAKQLSQKLEQPIQKGTMNGARDQGTKWLEPWEGSCIVRRIDIHIPFGHTDPLSSHSHPDELAEVKS